MSNRIPVIGTVQRFTKQTHTNYKGSPFTMRDLSVVHGKADNLYYYYDPRLPDISCIDHGNV